MLKCSLSLLCFCPTQNAHARKAISVTMEKSYCKKGYTLPAIFCTISTEIYREFVSCPRQFMINNNISYWFEMEATGHHTFVNILSFHSFHSLGFCVILVIQFTYAIFSIHWNLQILFLNCKNKVQRRSNVLYAYHFKLFFSRS
jgi:hypothetical protein